MAVGRSELFEEVHVSDNVYSLSEVVGTSATSLAGAIRGAMGRASQTVRNLDWFEVTQLRGHIEDGHVGHFQVTLKVGFRLESPS